MTPFIRVMAAGTSVILASSAPSHAAPNPSLDVGKTVAVVIGISAYSNLPSAAELDFARADAKSVAQKLEATLDVSRVFSLGDGQATKAGISNTLRTEVAQLVGEKDTLIVYIVAHGIGQDLDMPVILAHDSTLEQGQDDGFELNAFASDLQTWIQAGRVVIVTDVIHSNNLDGIYFYGPAASDWPKLKENWLVISASKAQTPTEDGQFAPIFSSAMSTDADQDDDGVITAGELSTALTIRGEQIGITPDFNGRYQPDLPLVRLGEAPATGTENARVVIAYPDLQIGAAKFVWSGGRDHRIQCANLPQKTCTPACYVREVAAGPCALSGTYGEQQLRGELPLVQDGKYECYPDANRALTCQRSK